MSRFTKTIFFSVITAVCLLGVFKIGALKAFPVFPSLPPLNPVPRAIDQKIETLVDSPYVYESKEKLGTGVVNVLAGWNDLFEEPVAAWENDENILKGIGKGITDAFANTAGGLLRILTFPFTRLNIPLPDDGVSF